MDKRAIVLVVTALLAGSAQAFPFESVASFFARLFRGSAAKEATVVGRTTESAAYKGLERAAPVDVAGAGSTGRLIDPKPNFAVEPVAANRKDADAYKALRTSAASGDASAMLRMSEMTSSGRVLDPGEPWHGYWMFHAMRLGSQAAARKTRNECSSREDIRASDHWFDAACAATDGRTLYVGGIQSSLHPFPLGSPLLAK